ncbi:MAG: hypothetical protein Q4G58_11285 [bacterium]|nr:hypothetical protein [bacterium]
MEKEYLVSLEYGLCALATVGLFTTGIEFIKTKIKDYIKKTNCN